MIGFLYKRNGINFTSFVKGGDQETKRRAGTENVPAIAGFARAVADITPEVKQERQAKYFEFKQYLVEQLTARGIDFEINGELNPDGLNHVFNIWLKDISTYVMQTNLDLAGIAVSGGSACTAGSIEPSHVLTAMFGEDSPPRISESIRISFGIENTKEDLDRLVDAIDKTVQRLKRKEA